MSRSLSWSRSRTRSRSQSRSRTKPGPVFWSWSRSRHISGPGLGPGPSPVKFLVPALVPSHSGSRFHQLANCSFIIQCLPILASKPAYSRHMLRQQSSAGTSGPYTPHKGPSSLSWEFCDIHMSSIISSLPRGFGMPRNI